MDAALTRPGGGEPRPQCSFGPLTLPQPNIAGQFSVGSASGSCGLAVAGSSRGCSAFLDAGLDALGTAAALCWVAGLQPAAKALHCDFLLVPAAAVKQTAVLFTAPAIELFIAGIRGWEAGLRQCLNDGTTSAQ